ncbi:MAG: nicotinamide riboside transporter PnuC [Thermoanaerobaculia bacterium]
MANDQTLPQPAARAHPRLSAGELLVMAVVSAALFTATAMSWWPIPAIEVFGFVTGGICVWLVVRENLWNWPIGAANSVIFFVLFWQARLFADAGLQILYFVLNVYGWFHWLRGGTNHGTLAISRAPRLQWLVIAALVPFAVLGLREGLIAVNGAAPLFDSITAVLSLTAQFMQTRKQIEHWLFWIAADLIYIPLYVARDLPLTAALYAVFLLMCLVGWRDWRRQMLRDSIVQI